MDQLDLVDIYRTFHPKRFFDTSVLRSFVTGLVTGHGAAVELCPNSFHKGKRETRKGAAPVREGICGESCRSTHLA